MRLTFAFTVLAILPMAAFAAPDLSGADPHWIEDKATQCWAADADPEPGETVSWSGACENGLIAGEGRLTWTKDGKITGIDEGTFKAGELSGHGRIVRDDGAIYEGDFPGTGILRLPDGTTLPAQSIKEVAGWSVEEARAAPAPTQRPR